MTSKKKKVATIKVGDYIRVTKTDYLGELAEFLLANDVKVVKASKTSKTGYVVVDINVDMYDSGHSTWTLDGTCDIYHKVDDKV